MKGFSCTDLDSLGLLPPPPGPLKDQIDRKRYYITDKGDGLDRPDGCLDPEAVHPANARDVLRIASNYTFNFIL